MSVQILETKTIDRCLSLVYDYTNAEFGCYGYTHFDSIIADRLGQQIRADNAAEHFDRYGERIELEAYRYPLKRCTTWEALSATDCVLCNLPTGELFRKLKDCRDNFALAMLRGMPDYNAVQWNEY